MRVLFFGDGAWATNSLRQLVQEDYDLLGVVVRTGPTDLALLTLAEELQLAVFQPERVNAPEFVAQVMALTPDLNLSVSYDQILRRPILETAPKGFINFHAGKLPYYRGRNVINWAIINGEDKIGLTAHYVDEGIDTGDIILQHTLPIAWTDTYGDVLHNVIVAFPDFVSEAVRLIVNDQVQPQPQAHLPGTYFAGRGEGDEWLDWFDSSRNLYNKIRGITRPGPGARTLLGDQIVLIWRAFYDPTWPTYLATPGQVVGRRPGEGVIVKTGDSTLLVQEVQVDTCEAQTPPGWRIGTQLGVNLNAYLQDLQGRVADLEQMVEKLNKGQG